jgi:phosphatidate cytidylyltransferase
MFRTRVITAAILLPLFVGGLIYLPTLWWAAALLPLLFASAWEWAGLAGFGRSGRWGFCLAVLVTGVPVLLAAHYFDCAAIEQTAYWISVVFWLVFAPLWLRKGWHVRQPWLLMLTGWLLIVPTWLALVRLQAEPWMLLAVLGVVWIADSAAYFAGRLWGRRKLAPLISPGKTWEGVAGAAVAVAVYHALVWYFGFRGVVFEVGVFAALLVACLLPLSVIGDLFESWIKRQAGVKDSGTLLPGHGGILDRIDALTSTLPLAALVVPWLIQRA